MNQASTLHMRETPSSRGIENQEFNNTSQKDFTVDTDQDVNINNYLKTPEEIEADFILEIDATDCTDALKKYETLFRNGNKDTLSSGTLYHGFMEENY